MLSGLGKEGHSQGLEVALNLCLNFGFQLDLGLGICSEQLSELYRLPVSEQESSLLLNVDSDPFWLVQ